MMGGTAWHSSGSSHAMALLELRVYLGCVTGIDSFLVVFSRNPYLL